MALEQSASEVKLAGGTTEMTLLCAVVHGTTKLQDKLNDVMLADTE